MIVGLAGKTGAGKNYVAALLEKRGWRTLDLDQVAHRALEALAPDIDKRLGPGLLDDNGFVRRRELGAKVFASSESLAILEDITYPWIEEQTCRWLEEKPETPAAIHAINLHKTEIQHRLDAILWIRSPIRLRRKRVMKRDDRSWDELKGRFDAQKALNPKLFSSDAEVYNVRNSGNSRAVERRVDRILSRL